MKIVQFKFDNYYLKIKYLDYSIMEKEDKFTSNPYNINNKFINEDDIINIMSKLNINNFTINNINNYRRAFIHKSYCKLKDYEKYTNDINAIELQSNSYEILEFLGDSILGVTITKYLFSRYHQIYNQNEGFLTQLKNKLVNGDMLGYLADTVGFNQYIIISKHIEENCNGKNNRRILEDIFEAFIAAIYLDHNNYKIVEEFIINVFEKYVDFSELIIHDTNYKDQLLRYFQNNYKLQPNYKTIKVEDNLFKATVYREDVELGVGSDLTKRKAEQKAAKNTLKQLGLL